MSGRFYNREVELVIARSVKDKFFVTRDSITITGLRITFDIEKHLGSKPNTCNVSVFNLAEETRAFAQDRPLEVRLSAGYDGETSLLFRGDVRFSVSTLQGIDWETKFELGDGARAHRHGRMNKAFSPGVTGRQIIEAAGASYGIKIPKTVDDAKELLDQYASGFVAHGPTEQVLTNVLTPKGMSWSIQDGEMQILRDGEARKGEAYIISEDTGMIGTPDFGQPQRTKGGKKGKHLLTVKTLLRPELNPGRKIDVRARSVQGLFKIERVKHNGDSRGEQWETEIEAKAL